MREGGSVTDLGYDAHAWPVCQLCGDVREGRHLCTDCLRADVARFLSSRPEGHGRGTDRGGVPGFPGPWPTGREG
jgi:hypothetical protein